MSLLNMSLKDRFRAFKTRTRVFITSDISNEPDDTESLVRYLLYSNEFDTEGIVACTSTHLRKRVNPEDMITVIKAFGKVVDNLNEHVHPDMRYPTEQQLLDLVSSGPVVYGAEALKPDCPLSGGSARLIKALEESPEPLWVLCWGGHNVLAQALKHIHENRTPEVSADLRSRIRVYAISDQDDTGVWIRTKYPDIFYIVSVHGWCQYLRATWVGISGPVDESGPDAQIVSKKWLRDNIQIGPLGEAYPTYHFIMEGDTPTYLHLIPNGLGSPDHPEWGGWGGRYNAPDMSNTTRHYVDAMDKVVGQDGKTYNSNHATIWRWREAFQNDFAARMQWTLSSDPSKANHAPVVIVNGHLEGAQPLLIDVKVGEEIVLDASATYDPDGDDLTFTWFQYREATTGVVALPDPAVKDLEIVDIFRDAKRPGEKVKIQIPAAENCAIDFLTGRPEKRGQLFHSILTVKDNGTPSLSTYQRVVICAVNPDLLGGRPEFATTEDWLDSTS